MQVARANRKQEGPPFHEALVKFPIEDGSAFVEATIISPTTYHEPSNPLVRNTNRLAIFLHPWGRLGGSFSDPVLLSLIPTFIQRDWHIILYNSRGVGDSDGSISLTATAESQDLRDVVLNALNEIENVTEILLLGYSFGTLPVSMHPVRLVTSPDKPYISPDLFIRHVLISYPLSVLWFLTFFHSGTFMNALKQLIAEPGADVLVIHGDEDQFTKYSKYESLVAELRCTKNVQFIDSNLHNLSLKSPPPQYHSPEAAHSLSDGTHLATSPIIPPYLGTTSSRGCGEDGGCFLTLHTVKGGDHFWSKPDHRKELCTVLGNWLDRKYSPLMPITSSSPLVTGGVDNRGSSSVSGQ